MERKIVNGRLCEKVTVTCFICHGRGWDDVGGHMPRTKCRDCKGTGYDPDGPFEVWRALEPVPDRKAAKTKRET